MTTVIHELASPKPTIDAQQNGHHPEQTNGQLDGLAEGFIDGLGTIRPVNINNEMQTAYLDYAMSVIVARALPDVRDGLKPVHRRILYSMFRDLGLTADKPHKKSARIVGEVLGKYHPHGDTAVYDAMVRMAQDFSLRYPLVDGQGNFGSVDGDSAAAMRYTEARLAQISDFMLQDIEKDTVGWHDNFDNSLLEPDILPAMLPNLLINGSSGIAVGMATNIPPHNLSEVVDALAFMIDNYERAEELGVEELMRFIHGPDFPTGGILYRFREDTKGEENTDAIAQGYGTGRSRLILQAKAHFEEMSRNRSRIVVTELPYQTNKTALIERIASLVRDGKLDGITDLRDESDRTGMRIVIELTRNVDPKNVLERLFKYTPLQQTFGMQMLALVEGEPRTLSLKRMLYLFIQHREEIVRRRSEWELARARERAHILEGLLRALDILDEVIATIRASQRVDTARDNLVKKFKFTEIQAQAILDMQLRRLAALERKKLQDEYNEIKKRIKYLEELLADPKKILGVIKGELLLLKEKYGDARRTQLVERTKGTLTSTDLLPDQDVWVAVGSNGELSRQNVAPISKTSLRQAARHAEVALLTTNTRDYLYLVNKEGQCRRVSVHELPQDGSAVHLAELTDFTRRDDVSAAFTLPRDANGQSGYLFFATEQGIVKRITVADLAAAAHADPIVISVAPRDRLIAAFQTGGEQEVILVTASGQSIRFSEEDVRSMGLAAAGVGGIKLKKNDTVVFAGVVDPAGELLTMTVKGYGKRTPLSDYSTQGRNGGGIVSHKPSARTGNVACALVVPAIATDDDLIACITNRGAANPTELSLIPKMGRSVQGKECVAITPGVTVAGVQMALMPLEIPGPGAEVDGAKAVKDDQGAAKKKERKSSTSAVKSRAGKTTRTTQQKVADAMNGRAEARSRSTSAQPNNQKTSTAASGKKETAQAAVPTKTAPTKETKQAATKSASTPASTKAAQTASSPAQEKAKGTKNAKAREKDKTTATPRRAKSSTTTKASAMPAIKVTKAAAASKNGTTNAGGNSAPDASRPNRGKNQQPSQPAAQVATKATAEKSSSQKETPEKPTASQTKAVSKPTPANQKASPAKTRAAKKVATVSSVTRGQAGGGRRK